MSTKHPIQVGQTPLAPDLPEAVAHPSASEFREGDPEGVRVESIVDERVTKAVGLLSQSSAPYRSETALPTEDASSRRIERVSSPEASPDSPAEQSRNAELVTPASLLPASRPSRKGRLFAGGSQRRGVAVGELIDITEPKGMRITGSVAEGGLAAAIAIIQNWSTLVANGITPTMLPLLGPLLSTANATLLALKGRKPGTSETQDFVRKTVSSSIPGLVAIAALAGVGAWPGLASALLTVGGPLLVNTIAKGVRVFNDYREAKPERDAAKAALEALRLGGGKPTFRERASGAKDKAVSVAHSVGRGTKYVATNAPEASRKTAKVGIESAKILTSLPLAAVGGGLGFLVASLVPTGAIPVVGSLVTAVVSGVGIVVGVVAGGVLTYSFLSHWQEKIPGLNKLLKGPEPFPELAEWLANAKPGTRAKSAEAYQNAIDSNGSKKIAERLSDAEIADYNERVRLLYEADRKAYKGK